MKNLFDRKKSSIPLTGGIKRKISFAISITMAAFLFISTIAIFVLGSAIIKKGAGIERFEITKTLAIGADDNINGEVEDVETYASRHLWREACKKANLKYSGMTGPQIEKMMLDTDNIWIAARDTDEAVKECTSGVIADSMREIMKIRGSISEIFITDKFGGLICSSGKTSDFYQADEKWWQRAFNDGKGAIFFGPIEYDNSSGAWGSAIAVPIKDPSGEVLGICKSFVHIDRLLAFVMKFRLGMTGHASLVDENGNILTHKDMPPLIETEINHKSFLKLTNTPSGYLYATSDLHKKNSIISISSIDSKLLLDNGISWYVLLYQDRNEALKTLYVFITMLVALYIILIPICIPIGLFLGSRLVNPIIELGNIADRITNGDLDQTVTIRTGDEIEQLAETFKHMISAIKVGQNNLIKSKEELEQLAASQESLIEDRTKELTRTQEATLNILEDLTETKDKLEKYSKDLEGAMRIKTDFTATVSHELRTPLAAIKESIAIVLDGTAGHLETKQKEFLAIARRNVDRLTRLINDLLDFQKIEGGWMEFNIIKNDINSVVQATANALALIAKEKDLEFKFNLDKALPMIEFDKDRIEQALTNLISNAIRYTDKGSITLSTEKKDNFIKVSVKDTGIGIKKEDISRLFQRFGQLEPVSNRRMGGTGLGLAISKEIIDFHKGKITVDSKLGVGSTFSFILPIF